MLHVIERINAAILFASDETSSGFHGEREILERCSAVRLIPLIAWCNTAMFHSFIRPEVTCGVAEYPFDRFLVVGFTENIPGEGIGFCLYQDFWEER